MSSAAKSTPLLERILLALSPRIAAERAYHRQAYSLLSDGGGYDAAKESRLRDSQSQINSKARDEDHHIGSGNRSNLRLEARYLRRNDSITRCVRRFATNTVGSSISAQPLTDSDDFNKEAEDFWDDYKGSCDYRGRADLDKICRLTIESRPFDGETGFIKLSNGQIQPVEAERIVTPKERLTDKTIVDGVKINHAGQVEGWYVAPRNENGYPDSSKTEFISNGDFIHCSNTFRFDQVRGLPDLHPIINRLKDLHEFQTYTLNKAKLDQLEGWAVFTKSGGIPKNLISRHLADGRTSEDAVEEESKFGKFRYFKTGEDMKPLASQTPNDQFVPFVDFNLHLIAAALDVPYEFLILDFKQSSFSSNRAAIMAIMKALEDWHTWLVDEFLQRLWNWRIAMAIRDGDIRPAPVNKRTGKSQWALVRWSMSDLGWIDPKADSEAQKSEWNMASRSVDEFARRRGKTRAEVLEEKKKDIEAAAIIAADLTKTTGQPVSWRDIINAGIPGVTVNTAPTSKEVA